VFSGSRVRQRMSLATGACYGGLGNEPLDFDGIYRQLFRQTAALNANEHVRRLQHLRHRAHDARHLIGVDHRDEQDVCRTPVARAWPRRCSTRAVAVVCAE